MIPQELIRIKRDGGVLSHEHISMFLKGYVDGTVAEYQMSSMAMAIFFQGLNDQETSSWLQAMVASGHSCDWRAYRPQSSFVDKHSTGGVGDKTSLIILPLLVAEGLHVPMISGRGLGHTGGTLDKLESIPGFSPHLSFADFCSLVTRHGAAFGAQTPEFVPADKKLYALRDVTATVESQALISASIMSKKIAENLDVLVLDVKCGNGAFMKNLSDALALANRLTQLGERSGCKTLAAITNMDEPLGRALGNSLEVIECFDILQGKNGPEDTRDLSLQLAAGALSKARGVTHGEAYRRLAQHLTSGKAWDAFCLIAKAQGAQPSALTCWDWAYNGTESWPVEPANPGYINAIDSFLLGTLLVEMGAGRRHIQDRIHPGVGLTHVAKVGEWTNGTEQPLCFAHTPKEWDIGKKSALKDSLQKAFQTCPSQQAIEKKPLILQWVNV